MLITDDMVLCRGDAAKQAVSAWFDYLCALDCARMYGACREVYQATLEYARTRKQFGTTIGSFQVIQHYLVDAFIDLQQLESMLLMVSVKGESANVCERGRATAAAKAYYANQAVGITQQGIQIHGRAEHWPLLPSGDTCIIESWRPRAPHVTVYSGGGEAK